MATTDTGKEVKLLDAYTNAVTKKIDSFLNNEITLWSDIDSSITAPLDALATFLQGGGKRLRPAFCYLGFRIAGGQETNTEIIDAGCALELLHTFALVHDDFMDRADTRRGAPTVHQYLEAVYSQSEYTGDIEHFANSVAILAGDFAFTYADRFARGLPDRCLDVYDALKVELFAGQQMDLDASYRKVISEELISLIAQYKSGKYTIERPLQMGALLADEEAPHQLWTHFGKPLGEAFQLRDDILGIFGDESVTGKPVGDDIREGKYTLLISEALHRTDGTEKALIKQRGNSELTQQQITDIVAVIESCGARKAVDERIESLYETSMTALKQLKIPDDIFAFAQYLARYASWRES